MAMQLVRRAVPNARTRCATINGRTRQVREYRFGNKRVYVESQHLARTPRPQTVRDAILEEWDRHEPALRYLADH